MKLKNHTNQKFNINLLQITKIRITRFQTSPLHKLLLRIPLPSKPTPKDGLELLELKLKLQHSSMLKLVKSQWKNMK